MKPILMNVLKYAVPGVIVGVLGTLGVQKLRAGKKAATATPAADKKTGTDGQ